ncbi:uncharacterized protein [Eurosta solidaginis]|uniref:uncharacterized protein isoform X2 n=1 Tax=Eurosta solidaginis TaxID=178769 RepID=UPI0035315F92
MSLFDVLELLTEASDKQNFVIKDKKAFTEDNVLVHNIFVYSIPKQFTEDDVRRYFTKFGEVASVRLVADKKKSRRAAPKVGFVNFSDPVSACRALVKTNHRLQGSRIGVKAGDSWNQPGADKTLGRMHTHDCNTASCSKKRKEKNVQEPPNIASEPQVEEAATAMTAIESATLNDLNVLSLNDDCLEMICGLLVLRDQIHFARVCQRFYDVFKMYCKREYKIFDLCKMSQMTLWEIRDFFRFAGEYIEHVAGNIPYKNRERIAEFIRSFCKNLKRISFDDSKMRPDCLKKLLRNFPDLVELHLHDCSLNDMSVQSLLHLKNLETLELSENYEVTGKFMGALAQLKTLNLYGCSNIQTTNLIEICKQMKNLKSLDIRRCERLSSHFFEKMPEHCKELEVLKMSCPDFPFERIARLPALKQLELLRSASFGGTSHTMLLTELAVHKADQLESLKILARNSLTSEHFTPISELKQLKTFFCASNRAIGDEALRKLSKLELLEELVIKGAVDITNEALLRLLQNCTRLHHLNIQFCKNISTKFIAEAIDILRKRKEKSKRPLTIFVYGTSIEDYELAVCPIYDSALKAGIIKVAFHALNLDLGINDEVDLYDIWDDGWLEDDDDFDETDEEDDGFYFPDSDMDEDDINLAYDVFGQIYPQNFDIMW